MDDRGYVSIAYAWNAVRSGSRRAKRRGAIVLALFIVLAGLAVLLWGIAPDDASMPARGPDSQPAGKYVR